MTGDLKRKVDETGIAWDDRLMEEFGKMFCRKCADKGIGRSCETRYSMGVYAGRYCDPCWKDDSRNHDRTLDSGEKEATMKGYTKAELIVRCDALSAMHSTASEIMACLARGDTPDAEDRCVLDDGTSYHFKVFGVNRAHGGVILIAVSNGTTYYDSQLFEAACEHARLTATYEDKAWPYRDAFDRLKVQVKKEQECGAVCRMDPSMRCSKYKGHEGTHETKSMPNGPKENNGRWQFGNVLR